MHRLFENEQRLLANDIIIRGGTTVGMRSHPKKKSVRAHCNPISATNRNPRGSKGGPTKENWVGETQDLFLPLFYMNGLRRW